MPCHTKHELLKVIESIGKERDVFHLYNNIHDGDLRSFRDNSHKMI
ncbi:hypothetical protein [Salicibibacter cibi]